jgi:ribosome-associated toxin RatA of RatAB toxin-antitoxin module
MKTVHKSVLLHFSAEEMFALVTGVNQYPAFLPWCDRARVIDEDAAGMTAEIGMAFGGLHQSFTTRNQHTPGRQVRMQLVKGPFSRLDGVWDFVPLGASVDRACKVSFELHYDFASPTLRALVGPVFDKIAGNLVEAFVKRAEQVYT